MIVLLQKHEGMRPASAMIYRQRIQQIFANWPVVSLLRPKRFERDALLPVTSGCNQRLP